MNAAPAHMLAPETKAWLKANAARFEAEAAAWMKAGDALGGAPGPYPTGALEEQLVSELIACLGPRTARIFVEALSPPGGWDALEQADG